MNARRYLLTALKTYDALVIVLSFAAALAIAGEHVQETTASAVLSIRLELYKFLFILAVGWVSHLVLGSFGLYDSKRLDVWYREPVDLLFAMLVITLIAVTAAWVARFEMFAPALVAALLFGSAYVVTLSSRLVLRWLLRHIRRAGRNLNHVLIVGTNSRARSAAKEVSSSPELGCHLVGFVDESWHDPTLATGGCLVATFDTLRDYLRENVVDEVIICVPVKSLYDRAARVMEACREQGVNVRFMADVFAADIAGFDDYKLVCSVLGQHGAAALLLKRATDIVISACLLIACTPLFVVVAAFIKLGRDADGPVFFVQERVGRNKRRFKLYKFRTMTVDAEARRTELEHLNETAGPTFKARSDPRVTRIGRILRRTSIDELPQLINVLLGDMSLVGPRPLPVLDYAGFRSDRHRKRLSVRPGITCLWQIEGRSSIPFERWMELDLKYVDDWSLWLDFKILLKTIPAVVRTSGAS